VGYPQSSAFRRLTAVSDRATRSEPMTSPGSDLPSVNHRKESNRPLGPIVLTRATQASSRHSARFCEWGANVPDMRSTPPA